MSFISKIANWMMKHLVVFLEMLGKGIISIHSNLKKWLFGIAYWLKRQLDKHINHAQRERLHTIVFKSETPEGQRFDTILTWMIVCSIIVVITETISAFHEAYWWTFFILEWIFTIVFTIEYLLRLYCSRQPLKYSTSFFGIVDLLATIPSYLGLLFFGGQHLLIVRSLRLLRVFRIFKMGHFVSEGDVIISALKASRTKISLFLSFVILMAMIIGSILYIVEGGSNPDMDNIPKSIYWAVVTMTTVGYGDVTPITSLGKMLATLVMIMGYGILAVPTGIVTAEISGRVIKMRDVIFKKCPNCGQNEHHKNAEYCHKCSEEL